jgi:hypothetical protein
MNKETNLVEEKDPQLEAKKKSHQNFVQIKTMKINLCKNYILMGRALKENKDKLYWKELQYRSFQAFLGSPEVSVQPAFAYRLIAIYTKFCEQLKVKQELLEEIDMDKLYMITGLVNNKNIDEYLAKAKSLSRSDLRSEIQGEKIEDAVVEKSESGDVIVRDPLDFIDYCNVWIKRQPVSRWGTNPHETIFGQFFANIVHFYTKQGDIVHSYYINDNSVMVDVCQELQRDHIFTPISREIKEENKNKADLAFAIVDKDSEFLDKLKNIKEIVKLGGSFAIYEKGEFGMSEKKDNELKELILENNDNQFEIKDQIIIHERPNIKQLNNARKDEKMIPSYERIVIFTRKI